MQLFRPLPEGAHFYEIGDSVGAYPEEIDRHLDLMRRVQGLNTDDDARMEFWQLRERGVAGDPWGQLVMLRWVELATSTSSTYLAYEWAEEEFGAESSITFLALQKCLHVYAADQQTVV